MERTLTIKPLTADNFAPYGQVIEKENAEHFPINRGQCERFHDLCHMMLWRRCAPYRQYF